MTYVAFADDVIRHYRLARIGSTDSVMLVTRDLAIADFGIDRQGRVIVSGYAAASAQNAVAARYLPTGELDTSYGGGGIARLSPEMAHNVVVKLDGRAFFADFEGHVLALDAAGRLLPVLRAAPVGDRVNIYSIAAGPGETLLLTGAQGASNGFVARIHSDGRLDERFGRGGVVTLGGRLALRITAIVRDRRGRLIGVGNRRFNAAVVRLSARGAVDRSFGSRGIVVKRLGLVRGISIVSSWPTTWRSTTAGGS